jgi:hypothetical protein
MSPTTAQLMQQELAMNRVLRRDMARSRRRGALYMAEIVMETSLILDASAERQTIIKQLTCEVVPEWVGESTARRIVKAWHAAGLVDVESDPDDGRSSIIRPTAKMVDRANARWRDVEAAEVAVMQPTPRRSR